jgi:ribosome-binding protein aMBF1 (putative translation factor)
MTKDTTTGHRSWAEIKTARQASLSDTERAESEARAARLAGALRLGIAIRDAREAVGVTQTELAARMHVAQSAVSRIEAGRTNVTVVMLARIAEALGTPLSVRIGQEEASLAS